MNEKETLQAAYDLLTKRGKELALRTADGVWDGFIDSAQHYLGLLIMRIDLGQDLSGRITCPQCGMKSSNPSDAVNKYCGNCHQFHATMKGKQQ